MLDYLDLFHGLNINTIPFEFSQEMTIAKILAGIQEKVNTVVDIINNADNTSKQYTDEQISLVKKSIASIQNLIDTGDLIKDGTIKLSKMDSSFFNALMTEVQKDIYNVAKTVIFGIDDNGYFFADIPKSWQDINFSTDPEGHLILEYNI